MLTKEKIFETIKKNCIQILPELASVQIKPEDSLKDLGANSIDRSEIVISTMEELNLKVPLSEIGKATNINLLVDVFFNKSNEMEEI